MAVTPERRPRRLVRSLIAAGFASVLAGGAGLVPASAADEDMSFAGARFLSGSVLGTNLDEIVKLEGAQAQHAGDGPTVSEGNPLEISLLGTTLIDIPGGIQVPIEEIIKLGAVNQYATAGAAGVAGAGSGAVADNGAVGTGTEAGFPGTATFHLSDLLGEDFTSSIADIDLYAEAVTATAHVDASQGTSATDYEIASLYLEIGLPVLSDALGDVSEDVSNTLCSTPVVGEGTVLEIDLCDPAIRIDLNQWTDGTLNEMPPNTEVLNSEVLDELLDRIGTDVGSLLSDALAVAGAESAVSDALALVGGTSSLVEDATDQLTSAINELNGVLSIKVNVQGDERNPTGSGIDEFVGSQVNAGFAPALFLPTQEQPAECESAGVTALQVSVADGDVATVNLAAADAAGCAAAGDEGGDENGDGGDADGGGASGGGAGGGDGEEFLPDTGGTPVWLLPMGLALMTAGGVTAYVVNRRNRLMHG